ncbi:MAG: ribosome biogenesis GTP-binding protein YihA/YsxC [Defluviitaleaceae bacterium]|nr:ribosome biogenesis GTP-binding protein YihA/YsxC [Defluviitaleaceae bacterium]
MKIVNVNLAAVAVKPAGFPEVELPEMAFVGRSNVGKSSLINCLVGRKAIARVSQSPGKTRTINFYDIDNKMYFVDLPGYGYAKGPKEEIASWGKMIEGYLKDRHQLKGIVLLLDIRHAPSAQDLQMVEWLNHYKIQIIYVLTKMDKIKRSQIAKHVKMIRNTLGESKDTPMLPFSSETRQGKEELLAMISKTTFGEVLDGQANQTL